MKILIEKIKDQIDKIRYSKYRKTVYVLCYTALFVLCALVVFRQFITDGKGFIWSGSNGALDGMSQHYVALSYWGTYLRSIIRDLFDGGGFSIPLYDTSIGMGSDIIQTLSYYVIGDPLTLTSAFVPRAYTEYLYDFLILFRLWLAGLSFSLLASHFKKNNRFYTLIGSMIYVFSAYTLFAAVRHPYFTNPMIYFPLIILGAELIFKGKKPWLFILSVFLAAVSNFYFFYMIVFLTVIYVAVRVFSFAPKGERKKIFGYLFKIGGCAVLGVLMAAVLLYPSLRTTLASSRQGSQGPEVGIVYGLAYYKSYLYTLISTAGLGEWSFPGLIPLSLTGIFLMWCTPKKNKTLVTYFIICTVMLMFPVFGWFLNGMSYVSNRWVWGYCLLVALIFTLLMPSFHTLSKKKWAIYGIAAVVYAYGSNMAELTTNYHRLPMIGLLCGTTLFILVALAINDYNKRRSLIGLSAIALLVLQLYDFGTARYDLANYDLEFADSGTALDNVLNEQSQPLVNLGDTSYYRYENNTDNNSSNPVNAALVNGGHSTSSYFSLSSDHWYELLRSLGDTSTMVQHTVGLDHRTILGAISNVKYFSAVEQNYDGAVPYGYTDQPLFTAVLKNSKYYRSNATGRLDKTVTYSYYENENALPFGYTYDSYITREEYDTLSTTDRQTALLYNAVLEDEETALPKGKLPEETVPLDYTVTFNDVEQEGDVYTTFGSGTITLKLKNADPNKETYISFNNATFVQHDPVTMAKNEEVWEDLLPREQKELEKKAAYYEMPSTVFVYASMSGTDNMATINTPTYTYYSGSHDFTLNMGYHTEAPGKIVIRLPKAGEYTLEDITVTQLDLTGYEEQCAALSEEHLQNVEFTDNRITGDITVSSAKMLCLALPYSDGWTAYVDGKETPIKSVDIAFMGLELEAGTHTIELKYFTPYLLPGILGSVAGWGIFVLWLCIDIFKNKRKGK